MHYVELDAKNLARWFGGAIGASGALTRDPVNSPNNFVVYISDRRGNYVQNQTWAGNWPPLSPNQHETGEYGWTEFVNPNNAPTGCPIAPSIPAKTWTARLSSTFMESRTIPTF